MAASQSCQLTIARGWGRSVAKPSERGHTGPTSRVLDDITSFLKTVIPCPTPLFLMGHSMGGGEVLLYMSTGPAEIRKHIRGYLLESPFIDFDPKSKPSSITVTLGRLAGKVLPHHQMTNPLDVTLVTRNPAVQKQFTEDELCHDTGTLQGLAGMLDRTADLASGKVDIGDDAGEGGVTRVWIGHGDKDGITNYHATKALADRLPVKDKEFKTYAGCYHRCKWYAICTIALLTGPVHDEPSPDGEMFVDDVANWVLSRSEDPVQVEESKPRL